MIGEENVVAVTPLLSHLSCRREQVWTKEHLAAEEIELNVLNVLWVVRIFPLVALYACNTEHYPETDIHLPFCPF